MPPDLTAAARRDAAPCSADVRRRRARRAGRAQPPQRRRRAESDRARRGRRAGRGRALADFAGRRPALRERSGTPPTARRSSTTTPTTRPRSAPRSTPPARGARAASSRSSSRTCSARTQREAKAFGARARAGRPGRVLDVYPARERQEDYPGVTGLLVAQAHRRRRPRQARHLGARRTPPPSDFLRTNVAAGRPAAHDGRRRREHDRAGTWSRRANGSTRTMTAPQESDSAPRSPSSCCTGAAAICGCATPASSRSATSQITGITASDGDKVRAALESGGPGHDDPQRPRADPARGDRAVQLGRRPAGPGRLPAHAPIRVIERRPVAALAGRRRTADSGHQQRHAAARSDGGARSAERDAASPTRPVRASRTARSSARSPSRAPLPTPLRGRTNEVKVDKRGVIVDLDEGPELIFGGGDEADQKWAAAARVLAEISARGSHLSRPSRFPVAWLQAALRRSSHRTPDPNALNLRLRMPLLSIRSRDFGSLQRSLRGFALVDIGNEIPVPCGNPRRQRAC